MVSIYNKISDYVIILNYIGEIVFCNESFLDKLGYTYKEFINKNINILKNKDINTIKEGLELNRVLEFYSKTNESIQVNCNISIDKFENEKSIFIIGREISNKLYTMEMLEQLLDNIDISTFILDSEEKFLYVNDAFSTFANKKKEEILGSHNSEHWHGDDYKEFRKNNNDVFDIRRPKIFNEKLQIGTNTSWYESYKAPIYDENGQPKYIMATTKNISLTKAICEEIYANYNILKIINKDHTSSRDTDLNIILNKIGDMILDYTQADGLSILLYDEEKGGLVPTASLGNSVEQLEGVDVIELDLDTLNKEKNKNHYNCISSKEEVSKIIELPSQNLEDLCFVGNYTIELYEEYIGAICLSYTKGNEPKFNSDEYMKYVCGKLAMIIKNTRLLYELSIENSKREDTEKELEQYLDVSVDLVATLGENGDFKRVNPNWTNVLGWTTEELLSMSIVDIAHPEELKKYVKKGHTISQDKNLRRKVIRLRHKNNRYVLLEWSSKYIKDKQIYITSARDITKYVEVEKEKVKLEEAVQQEIVRNEFFSNISHEFRTPINIILGTMQVINKNIERDNITNDNLKKYTTYIKQNSYRLLRLVNNLIDISRMDIGMYELRCSNENIVNIIEDITLSVADYTKNNNINLLFDTDSEEVITLCDPDKIERIMLNLLSNAIKYTPKDGLIKVEISTTQNEVSISVKDNGIGIPKEKIKDIFDRFGQVDDSLNRKCEGSGIGLSLVKNLVEMHQGKIDIDSKINEGSEFIFTIPIKIKEDNDTVYSDDRIRKHVERCDIEFSDIYTI